MFRLIKLFIWITVIIGIITYINYKTILNYTLDKDLSIDVKSGYTLTKTLEENLNLNPIFLKIYLKLHPVNFNLETGNYSLNKGENLENIIKNFKYGAKDLQKKVTILEGWNIFDIDALLVDIGLINKGDFIANAKNVEEYKKDFPFLGNAISLEGFLYPDTYFVNPNNFDIKVFTKVLLNNFNKKTGDLIKDKTNSEILETINLASIVEKEVNKNNPEEIGIVAGILKKRYKENWFIGADITVCYPHKLTQDECKMVVSKYITEKNDYNTRTMNGLPKTPIGNPSIETIKAVFNPTPSPYYYYLHKNGKIYYARTNEEHNNNK